MASGLFVSGWINYILRHYYEWDWKEGYPVLFGVYAVVGLIKACLTLLLTNRCERDYSSRGEDYNEEREATAPLLHSNRAVSRASHSKPTGLTAPIRRMWFTVNSKMSSYRRGVLIKLCLLFMLNSFVRLFSGNEIETFANPLGKIRHQPYFR